MHTTNTNTITSPPDSPNSPPEVHNSHLLEEEEAPGGTVEQGMMGREEEEDEGDEGDPEACLFS